MSVIYYRMVVLMVLALPAVAADNFKLSPQQQKSLGIQTVSIGVSSGTARIGWPARVKVLPGKLRMVAAPVSGLVTQLRKAPGDRVKAGQTLALLSSTELLADQRTLMTANARLKLAGDGVARDLKLFAEGIIAESRLRAAQAELTQAQAEFNAQTATLRAYGLDKQAVSRIGSGQLSTNLPIASPLSGVVLERRTTVGDRVAAGEPLYMVADLSRLMLDIQVPADQARQTTIGQAVTLSGSQATGKVTGIGAMVGGAQTLGIRAEVHDPQNLLRPGQQVEARLAVTAAGGQWEVPAQSLAWKSSQPYLFIATGDGFRAVPVRLISQTADRAFVSGNLTGKERIATAGLAGLKALWQGGGE
jgi:cobalt-zinc-cadmium efflux system membrane fusion protein